MRNVTIVESNVEPNKEHLWFYNGELKWFGPNGWEKIYSQALSPTTTPKPTGNSIEFINHTNVNIQLVNVIHSTGSTISPYIQPNQECILGYNADNNGVAEIFTLPNALPFSFLKITAFKDGGQGYNVPYEHYQNSVSGNHFYKFSFKELVEKGFTTVSINGNVSNSSDNTTTTSSPIPGSDVRFTNNTNTDIQIYGVLYNGNTASPPMQPGQTYILRCISDRVAVYNSPNYRPFDYLKITAFRGKKQEEVPYIIDTDTVVNGVMYKFPEGLSWEEITEISIEGSIQGTGTTSSTPRPDPATSTTSTPKPTTTTSSTPIPNSIQFKNETNVSLILSEVNAGNGASVSPPILPNGDYILGPRNDDAYIYTMPDQVPFNSLEITAFKVTGESLNVPYESEVQSNGSTWYKFSFKELVDNEAIEVIIKGYVVEVYNETYPDTTLAIAITDNHLNNFSPSEIHYSCDFGSTINIEPPTPAKKYLAVVRPKTSNSKDTIVAEIKFNTSYEGQYSLYPIETTESGSNKSFLFDLSTRISDIPSIDLISLYDYNSHTISTIPPFVDGNTPPFADEK